MTKADDVLNIDLDDDNILDHPPSMIIYGRPGIGKSTVVAKSFQNLFWLQTSKTVLRPYASWLRDNAAEAAEKGMSFPLGRRTIAATSNDGVTPIDVRPTLIAIIQRYVAAVTGGVCRYNGLVFDEYNEMMRLVFDSIKRDAKFKGNPSDAINGIKRWNKWICSLSQTINQVVAMVAHEKEPAYDDDPGPTKGRLKYKGGPAFPIGTEISPMAAAADICVRVHLKKVGNKHERLLLTQIDPLWEIKFRDMGVADEIALDDLRPVLERAGYQLSNNTAAKAA